MLGKKNDTSMKLKIFIASFALLVSSLFFLSDANAVNLKDQINSQLEAGADSSGLRVENREVDPRSYLVGFIQINLAVFGIAFIILTVVAGYYLVTSHNEPDKIEKAKKTIRGAIIGLIIVLLSYSITRFVGQRVLEATKFGSGLEERPGQEDYIHCCKACEVGGIVERGCDPFFLDRPSCTAFCESPNSTYGDCEYMGYIPADECEF